MPMHIFNDDGYACYVCSPRGATKSEVESFATKAHNPSRYGNFEAIDVTLMRPKKCPTPLQCARHPDRIHWFVVAYR